MTSGSLSHNEKLVLYGLIKHASLPDKEIYDRLDLKKSTFSAIKKKLQAKGYFTTLSMPVLHNIGCELLVVSYATLNRTTSLDQRLKVTKKFWNQSYGNFFVVSESNQSINITGARNITEFEKDFAQLLQLYDSHDFLDSRGLVPVLCPFDVLSVYSFFDYAPLLNRLFDLGFEKDPSKTICQEKVGCKVREKEMSPMEKKIYYGLIKYPDISDFALANRIKTTRNTISKKKEAFFQEDLIRMKRIVNLNKLGFEILAFSHSKFNPRKTEAQKRRCMKEVLQIMTPIFAVAKSLECIRLAPFKNFEDFQLHQDKLTRFCVENNLLKEEPTTLLLSIPRMTAIKNHTYAPLVKEIIGI